MVDFKDNVDKLCLGYKTDEVDNLYRAIAIYNAVKPA